MLGKAKALVTIKYTKQNRHKLTVSSMFKYRIMPQLFARLFPDPKSQVVSIIF